MGRAASGRSVCRMGRRGYTRVYHRTPGALRDPDHGNDLDPGGPVESVRVDPSDAPGDEIVITEDDRPVARLTAATRPMTPPRPHRGSSAVRCSTWPWTLMHRWTISGSTWDRSEASELMTGLTGGRHDPHRHPRQPPGALAGGMGRRSAAGAPSGPGGRAGRDQDAGGPRPQHAAGGDGRRAPGCSPRRSSGRSPTARSTWRCTA